jgi:hypothetical protein
MRHPGAGAVRQDVAGSCVSRPAEKAGDTLAVADGNRDWLCNWAGHGGIVVRARTYDARILIYNG